MVLTWLKVRDIWLMGSSDSVSPNNCSKATAWQDLVVMGLITLYVLRRWTRHSMAFGRLIPLGHRHALNYRKCYHKSTTNDSPNRYNAIGSHRTSYWSLVTDEAIDSVPRWKRRGAGKPCRYMHDSEQLISILRKGQSMWAYYIRLDVVVSLKD